MIFSRILSVSVETSTESVIYARGKSHKYLFAKAATSLHLSSVFVDNND